MNGDRTKLEEVFLNILTNAKDALADCKYAPRLQFRAKKLDDKILIQCQDNGCGIPTEIVDKLYEPFFTTKENGTGLGLAVSKRIIEAHNGTMTKDMLTLLLNANTSKDGSKSDNVGNPTKSDTELADGGATARDYDSGGEIK